VIQAVDRLNLLVGRLLQFARSDNSSRAKLQLNVLVEETAALLRAKAAEQQVEVVTNLSDVLPWSVRHRGCSRSFSTWRPTPSRPCRPAVASNLERDLIRNRMLVQLELAIPAPASRWTSGAIIRAVFHDPGGGNRLGPGLCARLSAQHGGQIALEPREPCGTRCVVTLPCARSDGPFPLTDAHGQSKERVTILVADDDATIRANLVLLLRSENYDVLEAADGLQAARILDDCRVALALLDLSMPGMDGMEFCASTRIGWKRRP